MSSDSPAFQPAILAPVPPVARSLGFRLLPGSDAAGALRWLGDAFPADRCIAGLGEPLVRALGAAIPGLRPCPSLAGAGCAVPSTQQALWVFLRGDDRGEIFDLDRRVASGLAGAFALDDAIDLFRYRDGRDLTGYIDGTENPVEDRALAAAIVADGALRGSSFAAVQRWEHDLARFDAFAPAMRNAVMGRDRETNDELPDAPASAHVKRSAQESFDPPAFMVRRSMPWAGNDARGLEFIAYGCDLDRYERVLRRMTGLEDGIVDGLFRFSRPVTGGFFWCPPTHAGRLDLRAIGIGPR